MRDRHADDVADRDEQPLRRLVRAERQEAGWSHYAFKCTAASGGNDYLADLRGSSRSHFIATTVDLLTTGVDVPCVSNIVFFKYVRSRPSPSTRWWAAARALTRRPAS